jgi:hypothetical protein
VCLPCCPIQNAQALSEAAEEVQRAQQAQHVAQQQDAAQHEPPQHAAQPRADRAPYCIGGAVPAASQLYSPRAAPPPPHAPHSHHHHHHTTDAQHAASNLEADAGLCLSPGSPRASSRAAAGFAVDAHGSSACEQRAELADGSFLAAANRLVHRSVTAALFADEEDGYDEAEPYDTAAMVPAAVEAVGGAHRRATDESSEDCASSDAGAPTLSSGGVSSDAGGCESTVVSAGGADAEEHELEQRAGLQLMSYSGKPSYEASAYGKPSQPPAVGNDGRMPYSPAAAGHALAALEGGAALCVISTALSPAHKPLRGPLPRRTTEGGAASPNAGQALQQQQQPFTPPAVQLMPARRRSAEGGAGAPPSSPAHAPPPPQGAPIPQPASSSHHARGAHPQRRRMRSPRGSSGGGSPSSPTASSPSASFPAATSPAAAASAQLPPSFLCVAGHLEVFLQPDGSLAVRPSSDAQLVAAATGELRLH